MADSNQSADTQQGGSGDDFKIEIRRPQRYIDFATILGLVFALALIATAILIGQSNANFFNASAMFIVVFGTMAVTSVSYTGEELGKAWRIIAASFLRRVHNPGQVAHQLLDLAVMTRKRGLLALTSVEDELAKDPFLNYAAQMAADGIEADEIDRIISQDIDSQVERHRISAGIVRRASEIAPGMGLIGTLVGLVQMLAQLENPESVGPAMAVALLTTFYGAVLGTVVLGPLAAKLERNANQDMLVKSLIREAMTGIARQENTRRLEMTLNSILPPKDRIRYFN
jgi:chemotaxis protein MotA